MGLLWEIIKSSASTQEGNGKNSDLENEMNLYDLEEWQKELVRKREYSPSSFEEDGQLEEDDYYYDDDK